VNKLLEIGKRRKTKSSDTERLTCELLKEDGGGAYPKTTTDFRDSAEGPSSIRKVRKTPPWTRSRCTNWKIASRFVNMCRLLLLGAYPSGV
jgi:hypothetical protein